MGKKTLRVKKKVFVFTVLWYNRFDPGFEPHGFEPTVLPLYKTQVKTTVFWVMLVPDSNPEVLSKLLTASSFCSN